MAEAENCYPVLLRTGESRRLLDELNLSLPPRTRSSELDDSIRIGTGHQSPARCRREDSNLHAF